jgi:hypothetical protein
LRRHRGDQTRQATCQAARLAFDRTLPPSEALGRIRDAFHDYDEGGKAALCVHTSGPPDLQIRGPTWRPVASTAHAGAGFST